MRRHLQTRVKQAVRESPEKFECWMKLNSVSRHIERNGRYGDQHRRRVIYMAEAKSSATAAGMRCPQE